MIDSFHFDAYNEVAVNYNRDIEMFPVIKRIIEKITGKSPFINLLQIWELIGRFCIIDDEVVKEASRQEVIRRYYATACEYKKGYIDDEVFQRAKLIMESLNLKEEDRSVVMPARERAARMKKEENRNEVCSAVALELEDGTIITGKASNVMSAASAVILNAIKYCAHISDNIYLLSPVVLEPIINLKTKTLGIKNAPLNCEEILIALSISAATNPTAQVALEQLTKLKGCQAHSTTILSRNEEQTIRTLGIDITCDPEYPSESLYYNS